MDVISLHLPLTCWDELKGLREHRRGMKAALDGRRRSRKMGSGAEVLGKVLTSLSLRVQKEHAEPFANYINPPA